jgi:uncharacterized protein
MIDGLTAATAGVTLTNARSRAVIARDVELALTRAARRQGLLKRPALPLDTALLLAPCFMVHTAFMQFPIDIVFVDRRGYVRHLVRNVGPWRLAASARAYATIELPAGTLDKHDLVVGDRLCLGVAMSVKLSA